MEWEAVEPCTESGGLDMFYYVTFEFSEESATEAVLQLIRNGLPLGPILDFIGEDWIAEHFNREEW